MAQKTSGFSSNCSYGNKIATVVLGVWSRKVMVYGMSLYRRKIHGSSSSQTRHDHARYPSRNTAIARFDRDAEQTLQPQSQDRSQMA